MFLSGHSASMPTSLLIADAVTKSYPGVRALAGVGLTILPGEVHALVGENGAGKSTLSRILAGIIQPDSGKLTLAGQAFCPASRRDAEKAGVRIVTQELNLIPTLSVAENIYLDHLPRRLGCVNYPRLNTNAAALLGRVGLRDIAPSCPVGTLGVGQQQMVEIARGLGGAACKLLILDEPTASLTAREIALLFEQIRMLKSAGTSILYISHRMEEIRQISDRLTILRDGQWVGTFHTPAITMPQIIRHMVGRDIGDLHPPAYERGPIALRVRNLTAGSTVRGVSFDLHRGEIMGFAGLVGSGRTETLRAIFGADRCESGQIFLHDQPDPTAIRSPHDAVAYRMAFLTEDRKGQGLLLPWSITDNVTLTDLPRLSLGRIVRRRSSEHQVATGLSTRLGIRARDVSQRVGELSGGNQQKVVIAKWLFRDADILLFDEPTRGIDVGAKFEIYKLLADLATAGKAIMVVSSDMLELLGLCDRIAVMSAGRLVQTFTRDQFNQEAMMAAALSQYSNASA